MISGIHDLTLRQFAEKLGTVTAHSKPIDQVLHLKGRRSQVDTVQQAIYAAGRHVFIFGERGVGKTSLAKTAGLAAVEKRSDFKQFGCSTDTTFDSLMRQVIETFAPKKLASRAVKKDMGISKVLNISQQREESYAAIDDLTVPWAADVLASLDDDGRKTVRVVVVDEVDRVVSVEARRDFAELVKLLGDRGATITFIFTGVGADIHAILGHHPSSFRQFAQVELHRMDLQPALDIVDDALDLFGLSWDVEPTRTARFRIAAIANGFPYYVHLLTEKILYAIFADKDATAIELAHLSAAITAAVNDAQEEIRKPYDKATRGRSDAYKLVAWAVADSWDLERSTTQIFQSFSALCDRANVIQLSQKQMVQVLASMKREGYGKLLAKGFRHGQYQFSENIVRGYVRLCALADGVELNDLSPKDDRHVVHATARERRYVDPRRAGSAPTGFERR
jgi:hypothetical protein